MTIQPSSMEYPRRPARSWRGVTATVTVALALASAAGCALAAPYNPDNLPADQVARIDELCQSVIGVQPGEAHYVGCVVSLTGSANRLGHGHALAQARESCLRQGLQPDTPALSECVLRSDRATPLPASVTVTEAAAAGKASNLGEAVAPKSYFYTSPRDVRRRVEMSCAQLGFEPGSDALMRCAASLRASLFAADNPWS